MYYKIILMFGLVFFSGCAGFPKETINLSNGDKKKDILKYYGTPENRQFDGDYEAWQYCIRGTGFGVSSFRTIWLYKGNVTGVISYEEQGGCSFKAINWKDAPNYTIEIRDR